MFHIYKRRGNSFEFRFSIQQHGKAALECIYDRLRISKVKLNIKENVVTYNVIANDEIFPKFSLNTNKHLTYNLFLQRSLKKIAKGSSSPE